jgi:hypothetical protein
MSNPNPVKKFTSETASAAGKKSKRGRSWKTVIRDILDSKMDGTELTYREQIALKAALDALEGDGKARDFLADREEGKPNQTIEQNTQAELTVKSPIAEAIREAREAEQKAD